MNNDNYFEAMRGHHARCTADTAFVVAGRPRRREGVVWHAASRV